jgi:hypothetical protein
MDVRLESNCPRLSLLVFFIPHRRKQIRRLTAPLWVLLMLLLAE